MKYTTVKIKIESKINGPGTFVLLCPRCLGSGKVRAMQNYMTYDAGTIRGPDTFVKCPDCNGTGRRN